MWTNQLFNVEEILTFFLLTYNGAQNLHARLRFGGTGTGKTPIGGTRVVNETGPLDVFGVLFRLNYTPNREVLAQALTGVQSD